MFRFAVAWFFTATPISLNKLHVQTSVVNCLIFYRLTRIRTFCFSSLRECVEISKAQKIHSQMIKTSTDSLFFHNHLINAYLRCGEMEDACYLFDEMPVKNVVSWTILIAGFARMGFSAEAISAFSDMHKAYIIPNEYTFVSTLQACSSERVELVFLLQVYSLLIRLGFENNIFLKNAFLTALIRHGLLDEALREFEIKGPSNLDVVSWNAILDGFLKFRVTEIPCFFKKMVLSGINPDEFTFATVLTGLAELLNSEMGVQVHALLIKSGHGSERCAGNALVDMYLKNIRLKDGLKAFQDIPVKDVCSWTQLAAGCLNCGKPLEALKVIENMRFAGVKPNMFTLATGLSACANIPNLDEGQKLQGLMIKLGDEIDVCVENTLLDLYSRCGSMDLASKVFRSMSDRSVVSWTSMIMGYAQNGRPEEALALFEEMIGFGEKPNHITFICVLYACSQGGYIDKAVKYFSSMSQEHGIAPGEDHYACMVNLLGRAGRIREAEELIIGMPFEPSVVTWQTLLGSCHLYRDVETARRAAEHAVAADSSDPSTYMLLSNTFMDLEKWGKAETLRKYIENKDIKKNPGTSWLQVNERC